MSTGKKKWIGAVAAVALVVVGVVVFTSRDSGGASDKDLIITAAVKRQTLQDKVTLSGTLGRVEQRKVNAAAEGRISRTYLDDGVDVAPGQAILAIDGRDAVAEPGEFPFYRTLDVGAQGPDVRQLEQILATAGYNPGPVDELYTEQTRFALAQWQAEHGYPGANQRSAKTVTVSLQPNGNGYTVGPQNTAAVTIGPDLGAPTGPVGRARPQQTPTGGTPRLSIRSVSGKTKEGQPAQFVVEADRDLDQNIAYEVAIGGNAAANDVIAPAGKITFPAGVRQVPLNIPTVADGVSEGDEELQVTIVDGDTYDLGDNPTASTVISSDELPEVTITGTATVAEGGKVTLALSGSDAGGDVQVPLTIAGTATSALDFVPVTPVVTLNSGSSASIDVQTLTDTIIEPDETIVVSIGQSPNYKVGKISSAVITIQGASGDAAKPVLTLSPLTTSVTEGSPIQFSLGANSSAAADVELLLQFSGTASDGIDYLRPAGRLLLPAGQSSMTVSVPTVQDDLVESDEVVSVSLAPSAKYLIGNPSGGSVTIDSEDLPELQLVGGTTRVIGGTASRLAIVADHPPAQDTTVNYSVQGSAEPGQDFQPLTGTVVLHAGQTSVGVAVLTVNEDVVFHPTDMIVGAWPTRLGQVLVDEGEFVPAGTALVSLTDSGFTVTLKATASDRTKLQVGQQVSASLVGSSQTATGTISQLDDNATVNAETSEQSYEGKVELQGDLGAADGALVTLDVVIQEKQDALDRPDRVGEAERRGPGRRARHRSRPRRQDHRGPGDHRAQRRKLHRGHKGLEGRRGRDRRSRHAESLSMTALLELDGVSRTYGVEVKVYALRDVSLTISAGDFVSIVGPSGSGKSTMLGLLGCLDLPSDGVIRVGGVDVTTLDDAHRSKLRGDSIGFVFQQFHLIPHLTALGNVETALLYRDIARTAAPRASDAGARSRRARPARPPPAGADVRWRATARRDRAGDRDRTAHGARRRTNRCARHHQRRERDGDLPRPPVTRASGRDRDA